MVLPRGSRHRGGIFLRVPRHCSPLPLPHLHDVCINIWNLLFYEESAGLEDSFVVKLGDILRIYT